MEEGKDTLKKRFGLNLAAYGYNQVVSLALQFVLVPFFLSKWGEKLYGEWLVITGIPSMLTLLDMGVAQASASRATMEMASGDWKKIRAILNTATLFSGVVGMVVIIAFFLSGFVINWGSILNLHITSSVDAARVLTFMGIYLGIQFQGGVADAYFRTLGKFPLGAFLLANRRSLDIIVSIIGLLSGATLPQLACLMMMAQLVAITAIAITIKCISPVSLLGIKDASVRELKVILKPAISYMGFPIAQTAALSGGVQILNQLADSRAVVMFTMCRTFTRILIQLSIVSNQALRPELSRLAGEGKHEEIRRFTRKISLIIAAISTSVYLIMIATGPVFVTKWSHGKIIPTHLLVALVGLHALLNAMWFTSSANKIAQNKHTRIAVYYTVSSLAGLALWFVFRNNVGPIIGAALSLAIPEATMVAVEKLGERAERGKRKLIVSQAL